MRSVSGVVAAWVTSMVACGCVFVGMGCSGVAAAATDSHPTTKTYQVVTNEIVGKSADGKETEVYRFDPAVFVANQGDDVTIKIHGLKGHTHPVVLEGYGVRGVVERNQTLTLHVHADKPGMFRLICTTHADRAHEGPMEGYLVVVPNAKR